jgi:hypothetical protein
MGGGRRGAPSPLQGPRTLTDPFGTEKFNLKEGVDSLPLGRGGCVVNRPSRTIFLQFRPPTAYSFS